MCLRQRSCHRIKLVPSTYRFCKKKKKSELFEPLLPRVVFANFILIEHFDLALTTMSAIRELLRTTDEDKRRVREIFNKTEEDVQRDLNILLEWLEKQPHLPKPHDKIRLETCLLRNKFRVEQTKIKLDKYYTYRGIYPDFITNMDPSCPAVKNFQKSTLWAPLPRLTPNKERLTFVKFVEDQVDIFSWKDMFTYILIALDLQLTHDYAVGERYIIDVSTFTLKHLMKLDPNVTSKGLLLMEQAFSGRIISVDYINLPPKINYMLSVIKTVFNAKTFNKIKTYETLDLLYEVVPKEYLPKEYGGNEESLSVIHEKWAKELILQRDFLLTNAKRVSNEKLRIGEPIHNELFGVEGTFKKITLD